jgi:hypothetical protein
MSVLFLIVVVEKRPCHTAFSVRLPEGGFLEQKTLPNPPSGRKGLRHFLDPQIVRNKLRKSAKSITSSQPATVGKHAGAA